MNDIYLSVIIPVHNEAQILRDSVIKVISYCEKFYGYRYEVLLVENGSTDGTPMIVNELQRTYRPVKALYIEERSKAGAVRAGMLAAVGEYRLMCDADLSVPLDNLKGVFDMVRNGWDIIIGSREHPDSKVSTSFKRWAIGRVFSGITSAVLPELDYRDTQCGFKLFTARAAGEIFKRATCQSMAFDVEVLYLALQMGFYCTEVPVIWENRPESRVRLIEDSLLMLKDVLQIKKRHQHVKPFYKTKKVPA